MGDFKAFCKAIDTIKEKCGLGEDEALNKIADNWWTSVAGENLDAKVNTVVDKIVKEMGV